MAVLKQYNETTQQWEAMNFVGDNYSNRNLLDNPWFTVNQRGQTSYGGNAYTVDRWKTQWDTALTVNDGYVTKLEQWDIRQIFENPLPAGTYTFSAYIRNASENRFRIFFDGYETIEYDCSGYRGDEWKLFTTTFTTSANIGQIQLFSTCEAGVNFSIDIKCVKLELGSISTLANDVAPNYAEELIKCKYYFERYHCDGYGVVGTLTRYDTTFEVPFVYECSKRIAPSFSVVGTFVALYSSSATNVTFRAAGSVNRNSAILEFNGSTVCSTGYIRANNATGSYIDISADL